MKKWVLVLTTLLLLILLACGIVWLKFNTGLFLSSQAKALVNQVHDAFVRVESEQTKLPPVTNDREKLERMYDLDQCGREAFSHLDFSMLSESELNIARHVAWIEISRYDAKNQKVFKKLIPKEGWFNRSVWGDQAADAAFYIVQHSGDPELRRMALARMKPLLASGEVAPFNYARLYDRVALFFDHKPQRYGTQFTCRNAVLQPDGIEDPTHVDERRKAIGLTTTAAENMESVRKESGALCR